MPAIYIPDDYFSFSGESLLLPKYYEGYIKDVIIPRGLIQDRVEKLAMEIKEYYKGRPIYILCVLKGGEAFFADLSRELRRIQKQEDESSNSCFSFDFIKTKSYHGTETTGTVDISVLGLDPALVRGRDVLIVEDIVDTGLTMEKLVKYLHMLEPRDIKVSCLLGKRRGGKLSFQPDFLGFSIPDVFVIGYCMDYNEAYRDLDHIGVINAAGIERFKNGQ